MVFNLHEKLEDLLPWQDSQWTYLTGQIDSGKLPHAIILSGPSHTGKEYFAKYFAFLILCKSPIKKMPCGQCKSCLLNKSGNQPDLKIIQPEPKSKIINIDVIRNLEDFFSQTAQQQGWKIVVISSAESMNINASNALLKSLEEPSLKTLIILVCSNPVRLPITVKSRCQQLNFPVPNETEVSLWLNNKLPNYKKINELIEYANGRPILAMDIADTDYIQARRDFNKSMDGLAFNNLLPLDIAEIYKKNDPELIIDWLYYKLAFEIKSKDNITSLMLAFRYMDKLIQAKKWIQSTSNPNLQLIWEELFMNWKYLFITRKSNDTLLK